MSASFGPDREFWQQRFEADDMPWDRGGANEQAAKWIADRRVRTGDTVVVPGCGSGWELVPFAQVGAQVIGVDYAAGAVERAQHLLSDSGLPGTVEQGDVLVWGPPEPVDVVYEQTCLSALHPIDWRSYADQLARWIRPGGVLLAQFMQSAPLWASRPEAEHGRIYGPPYHCDITSMRALFPEPTWVWPSPPYDLIDHDMGVSELAVAITRAG